MRSSLGSVLGLCIQDILSAKPRYTHIYIYTYVDTHAYAGVRGCVIICIYIYIYTCIFVH